MARVHANVNAQLGPGWYDYGKIPSPSRLTAPDSQSPTLVRSRGRIQGYRGHLPFVLHCEICILLHAVATKPSLEGSSDVGRRTLTVQCHTDARPVM